MTPASRRFAIVQRLANNAHTQAQLMTLFSCSPRTIRSDFTYLEQRYPHRIHKETHGRTLLYRWQGPLPHLVQPALESIDHHQLIALVAARGLLHNPHQCGFTGPLDGALDDLLHHMGVADIANDLHPQAIEVDRFATCPERPDDLLTALEAVIGGMALRGRYRNRLDQARDQHILPLRLLLIEGEFHLLAWESSRRPVSDLRLSRFESLCTDHRLPPGAPCRDDPQLLAKIQRHREAAFRTHGNHNLKQRQRLQLAIGPQALPHLRDRTWGLEQTWDHHPPDLNPGWSRLSFITAGTAAAVHWILSLGDQVMVERPQDLRATIAKHAAALLAHHQSPKRPQP
ncbi:MAG: WYL domain-containing transcriptional regulator [Planctomycetota bacterium]|nr:MAG: WYL domain-containing transcriptional regulator [Planctomycetota bacterium]